MTRDQALSTIASNGSQWCVYPSLAFWWVSYICSDLYIRLEAYFMCKAGCTNTGCTDSGEASIFDMLSSVQEEYLNTESYLEDTSLGKESSKTQSLVDTYGKLKRTNSIPKEEMTSLVKGIKKEKSRPSRQKERMDEIIRTIQSPENDLRDITVQEDFSNTAVTGSLHPYCPSLRV